MTSAHSKYMVGVKVDCRNVIRNLMISSQMIKGEVNEEPPVKKKKMDQSN